MKRYDPSAIGSDLARSRLQYWARKLATILIYAFRLNRGGFFSTEFIQQLNPICCIPTKFGTVYCKAGHGRLRWRALTFYSEEPETIKWLESFDQNDVFWDIGANVGLYSIYAALYSKCKVVAVEPEEQNYALLVENVILNQIEGLVEITNVAISSHLGIGQLWVHAVTKGGAYNHFTFESSEADKMNHKKMSSSGAVQRQIGVSVDDMIGRFHFTPPTQMKIDVDGNEPDIIQGAESLLKSGQVKSILMEVQRGEPGHMKMLKTLDCFGYERVSERSNWESRQNREREKEHPATNMIFIRRPS
jgi:FkbM family methyltransferase